MLARVAESLYWMGRYIERCEHCARYLTVQYFSTLDAPMTQNREFTFRSIMFMAGAEFDMEASLQSKEVWRRVILDANNPNSLSSITYQARENARSIRNNISTELWEAINKWYLYYKTMDPQRFTSSNISEFSEQTTSHIYIIKSTMNMTLLHDDVWGFLNLGIHIERGIQVLRILRSKISDNQILSDNGANIPLMRYQWTTLLKCMEAFDVYNQSMKGAELNKSTIFKFLLTNELFPRSLGFTLKELLSTITNFSVRPFAYPEVLANFNAGKRECLAFNEFEDVDQVLSHIERSNEILSEFHDEIFKLYFQLNK